MTDNDLARLIREQNDVPLSAEQAAPFAALVRDVNARVAEAARQRLTIDATPWSHATLRAERAAE
jgi:hypothetical protein